MNKRKIKKTVCASLAAVSLMSVLTGQAMATEYFRVDADEYGAVAISTGSAPKAVAKLSFSDGPEVNESSSAFGTVSTSISASSFPEHGELRSSRAEAWIGSVLFLHDDWS